MRPEPSELDSRGARDRVRTGSRPASVRRAHLRRLALEGLEPRTLLATIPAPVVTGTSQLGAQIYGLNVQNVPSMPNDSSPTVAVDPLDPTKLVATWENRFIVPGANPPTVYTVNAAYSNDGGVNWNFLGTPGVRSYLTGMGSPPTSFTNTDSPSAGVRPQRQRLPARGAAQRPTTRTATSY